MMEDDKIKTTGAALDAASDALSDLKAAMREEINAATNAINAAYADRLKSARVKVAEAERAHIAAKDATPDHPWTGKRVFKMARPRGSSIWDRRPDVRVDGVVETWRSDSVRPANISSWRAPDIGVPIVREIKKDGKPSAKFERLFSDIHKSTRWQIVKADPA